MKFVGRDYELEQLDDQFQREGATLLILYGRRRVGKTRLITHWMQSRKVKGFYWVGTQTSNGMLLASFSAAVHKLITGKEPEWGFSYHSWEESFEYLARAIENRKQKTVIVLDEFTYAMDADTSLASVLQKMWDHRLKELPIMLILSGSHIGMMERDVISYRAPLFGRGTGRLHLRELPFKELIHFFPKYSIEERIAVYSILGGIPFYLEFFDPNRKISSNIRNRVISSGNLLQEEPRLLMHEQVQEPRLYISILQSIAYGNTSVSDIALDIGEDRSLANKYLTTMINLGLVARVVPATIRNPEKSKRGRYRITDPYLRFYFRFIHPRLADIATNMIADVIDNIKEHLVDFIGKNAFEDLCRQWVQSAAAIKLLPFYPEIVGSHWSAKEEIDVVAINWRSHHVLFGECKWGNTKPLNIEVVNKLQQQAANVIPKTPKGDLFEDHYIFFSRAGFTQEALIRIKEINGLAVDLVELERVLNMVGR